MKNLKLGTLTLIAVCMASIGAADAQSVKHDFMDAHAARLDIIKLKADRRRALRYKNWGKVAQDDRLIAQDKFWIARDKNKIRRAGG